MAAYMNLKKWLSSNVDQVFLDPPSSGCSESEAAPRFFDASLKEWHHACRQMRRCGLLRVLPSGSARPSLSAGAFAVAKDVRGC